jgi:hypothetical protein
MKRILTLGIVLVLMAALVIPGGVVAGVPAGPTTEVTGNITEATITITAPSAIAFGNFVFGDNIGQSATDGTVTVTPASRNGTAVPWSVTAADATNGGFMMNGATPLLSKLQISKVNSGYTDADTGITYTGNGNGTLPFWAKQNIAGSEATGAYTITITFTGAVVIPP